MIYYIEDTVLSEIELDQALSFAQYFLGLSDDILLNIKYFSGDEKSWGYCDQEDDNMEFTIEINKSITKEEMIETLFHELVHVRQISTGQYNIDEKTWDGVKYDCEYADRPWEIEAFSLQSKIYNEFVDGQ